MKRFKRFPLLFLGLVLAMLIMSACGPSSSNASSTLTPLQIIQNSGNAIKNLKTVHNDINATIKVSGVGTTANGNSDVAITMTGAGDQSFPDKQQTMDLTMDLGSTSTHVAEVITSDKIYTKTDEGPWYFMNASAFAQSGSTGISGIDEKSLLGLLETIKVTDHGDEKLNGQSLRHITADMDKATFTKLITDNPQLKSSLGAQDPTAILNNMKDLVASVDAYIDESQFYVHRTRLKMAFALDTNGTTVKTSMDMTIDMSKFNVPVKITVPTDAQPLTIPGQPTGTPPGQ